MAQSGTALFSFILTLLCLDPALGSAKGKAEAMKYFITPRSSSSAARAPASSSGRQRMLAISMGSLVNSQSYSWLAEESLGWNVAASYLRETDGYFSQGLHLEMQKFATPTEELAKISFLFSFTFPNRMSFPVYLGVAAGPGFFLKQSEQESDLTIDYKGYVGLRLTDDNSQYFIQSGVKNHLHVLSDGQFIGWYVSSGVAYKF